MCVGRNYVHVSSLLRSSIAASVALLLPVPVNCAGNRVGREWVRSGGYFPKGSDCPSYGFDCPPPQPAADALTRQPVRYENGRQAGQNTLKSDSCGVLVRRPLRALECKQGLGRYVIAALWSAAPVRNGRSASVHECNCRPASRVHKAADALCRSSEARPKVLTSGSGQELQNGSAAIAEALGSWSLYSDGP